MMDDVDNNAFSLSLSVRHLVLNDHPPYAWPISRACPS